MRYRLGGGAGPAQRLAEFAGDRRGNFAVATGAVGVALMLAVGFGINTAQLVLTRSNLLNALDAAVTSTARDLTTGVIAEKDARKTVIAFLKANGDLAFASSDDIALDSLVVDPVAKTVSAQASVDVAVLFPFFGTANDQHVVVDSAALYSDKKIEVTMMLDTTGSMKGQKIKDLISAAKNAVHLLLDNQKPGNKRVRVALVPYAEAVNTGDLAKDTVFDEVRNGPDLPPSIDDAGPVSLKSGPDNCATERKLKDGSADFSSDGPDSIRLDKKGKRYLAKVNRDDRLDICPQAKLIALTDNPQPLINSIGSFKADGVTAGAIALQWGYYMLSPQWASAIRNAGLGDGPAGYNARKVAKVAILMTDGLFNTAFAGVPRGEAPQNRQGDRSRSYAESICSNMKHDGIEVFTIGFDLDDPDMSAIERNGAKSLLKDCSSPDRPGVQHYFEASTGPELDQAFKDIIADTESLALTR